MKNRAKELTLGAFTKLLERGQTFFSGTPITKVMAIKSPVQPKSMAQRCVPPEQGVEIFIKHNHDPATSQIADRSW